jgi:hypothetical protein
MADARPATSGQRELMAAALAAISLVLFLIAVTEVLDAEWLYIASIIAGVGAVVTGMQARRGTGGTMATAAVVVGGILVLLLLGWILLALVGVIEDTG